MIIFWRTRRAKYISVLLLLYISVYYYLVDNGVHVIIFDVHGPFGNHCCLLGSKQLERH